ncbi:MAG TPA: preprotein translocase subunit SecE [Bryobacteraceae bacterium]|nr:preprotein translocase subunit SecE [Bryobacteraceae bacterium]
MEPNGAVERARNWPRRIKEYYSELRNEMKRVTWPSRKQVEGTTAVVIITVFMFGAYFFVVDAVLTRTVTQVYHVFTK